MSNEPKKPDGWNIAEHAGGLLLSSTGFSLDITEDELDRLVAILNKGGVGEIKDNDGDVVTVEVTDDSIILTRADDKLYPHGIVLPIEDFTEYEEDAAAPIIEGLRPAFKRVGKKIKRGFRVTSGRRKGQVVSNPSTAYKPPIAASTRNKLRIAAKKKKLIRALKSKMTRKKGISIRLRRMNHTD